MIAFAREVQQLRDLGAKDIILDPGYGFGKTLEQNYQLMNEAEKLKELQLPILGNIPQVDDIQVDWGDPPTSSNGTTVLNTLSLMKGANILRVLT